MLLLFLSGALVGGFLGIFLYSLLSIAHDSDQRQACQRCHAKHLADRVAVYQERLSANDMAWWEAA